jgi:hypothetical protein
MGGTQQALSSSFKTILNIVGASGARARISEISLGPDGAPNATDCQIVYDIASKDATTAGTGTAVTPQKEDPAARAATLAVNANYTAEPTTFTSVKSIALNQRASMVWQVADKEQMLILPATASLGLGVRALSPTYTNNVLVGYVYEEI